jgi:hypothetical protein
VSDPLLHVNDVTELGHLLLFYLPRRSQLCIPEVKRVKLRKSKSRSHGKY